MKAIVFEKYGAPDVLQVKNVETPAPKDNEVRIEVHATSVTAAEGMMRRGDTFMSRVILGLGRPRKRYRVLGIELAGDIESTGRHVTRFKKGDQVYGFTGFRLGGYAEFACLPETSSIALKPVNLSDEEAVSVVDGATTAYFFLKELGGIRKGQRVLIIGASGSIGAYAVQLARHFEADVTGVCSAANADLVKSLGADKVIYYAKEDFTKNGETYDIIFDTVGKTTFSRCKGSLVGRGLHLATTGNMITNYLLTAWTSMVGSKKFIFKMSVEKTAALLFLTELIEAGKLRPVIDRRYPMEQIVEAHRYVETGHKKGNVVITVRRDCNPGNSGSTRFMFADGYDRAGP
jgi:NADPH:quinone reductase-like Zn-dependent oxidoreductase